jgi:glucosyl-dolichyl phosphate glucuronosyltransferase
VSERISVILCTHNRAHHLVAALESLSAQSVSHGQFELIVVDNASTDGTREVVRAFAEGHPDMAIRLVLEARLGHNRARNSGIDASQGEIIAFMDDDGRASTDWLEKMLSAFATHGAWGVGGRVLPLYESEPPDWFRDEYETDTWGEIPRFLRRGESFSGNNMAFRRHVFDQFGRFNENLGMTGPRLSIGDETALYQRLWEESRGAARFFYQPDMIMCHLVLPHRLTLRYRLKRAFAEGIAYWQSRDAIKVRLLQVIVSGIRLAVVAGLAAVFLPRFARPPRRRWVAEKLAPAAREFGRLVGSLGIQPRLTERPGAMNVGRNV